MKQDLIKILLAFGIGCCYAAGIMSCASSKAPAQVASETLSQPVVVSETVSDATAEKTSEPVSGAFGIPLGKRFAPGMVAEVISQEAHSYRGQDKAKLQGTLYRVEPRIPSSYFTRYLVKTNKNGVIYNIEAEYEDQKQQNLCKRTEHLAELLEGKYGKPRGKGMLGDWYAFRESVSGPYKGVRLYAPKCRIGRYSISYSDDRAKEMELETPEQVVLESLPEPGEMSGL